MDDVIQLRRVLSQKRKRLLYLRGISAMLETRCTRLSTQIQTLAPQMNTLNCLVNEMRTTESEQRRQQPLSELFSLVQRMRCQLAGQRRRRASQTERKSYSAIMSGYHEERKCDGCVCPITLEQIPHGQGVIVHGTCFSRGALRECFKSQYLSGQHLHDPIVSAVKPEEFATLEKLQLIDSSMRASLEERYPVGHWVPHNHPDSRFQLRRIDY